MQHCTHLPSSAIADSDERMQESLSSHMLATKAADCRKTDLLNTKRHLEVLASKKHFVNKLPSLHTPGRDCGNVARAMVAAPALSKMTMLQQLHLTARLYDAEVMQLVPSLARLRQLTCLELRVAHLRGNAGCAVVQVLQVTTRLQSLTLTNAGATVARTSHELAYIPHIGNALAMRTALKDLFLTETRIRDHSDTAATRAAVEELLQHLRDLRQLEGALISVRLLDRMHGSSEEQRRPVSDANTAWLAGVPAFKEMDKSYGGHCNLDVEIV
jgi:hypothetical protein